MVIKDLSGKTKQIIILISVVIVIATGVILFIVKQKGMFQKGSQKQMDYVIPGVPYMGLYNYHENYNFGYGTSDTSAAVAEVMEYWNPGKTNLADIDRCFVRNIETSMLGVRACLSKFGDYDIQLAHLNNDELKNYVNSEAKTPLLFFLPVSLDQPSEITYLPLNLLIGVKKSQNKVILHSYWFGNNYEVSFDDFNKLWEKTDPRFRNTYLVVQPNNLQDKLKEMNSRKIFAYPERTSIMNNARKMFNNYALSEGALIIMDYDLAKKYQENILNDSNFQDYFPPYYKVRLYADMAAADLRDKDYDSAMGHINQAISLNHDLNQPFKDWPGAVFKNRTSENKGVASGVYRILGEIYFATDNLEKAKESYLKALSINPKDGQAESNLNAVELKLQGKK